MRRGEWGRRVFPSALDLRSTVGVCSLGKAVLYPQPPACRNRSAEAREGEGPFQAVPEPDSRTAELVTGSVCLGGHLGLPQ